MRVRIVMRLIRGACTVCLLYVAFQFIKWDSFVDVIGQIDAWLWPLAVVPAALQVVVTAQRWRTLMGAEARSIQLSQVVRISVLGAVANSYLISGIAGPLVKLLLAKGIGVRVRVALGSLLLERAVILFVLLLGTLIVVPLNLPHFGPQVTHWLMTFAAAACLGLVFGYAVLVHPKPSARLIATDAVAKRPRIAAAITEFRDMAKDARAIRRAFGWTLLSQTLLFGVYVSLGFMLGVHAGIATLVAVFPLVTLVSSIPISLGGWGVREITLVTALGAFGVRSDAALVLSIGVGVTVLAGAILAGLSATVVPVRTVDSQPEEAAPAANNVETSP